MTTKDRPTRTIKPAYQDRYDLPFDPKTQDIVCQRDTVTRHVDGYGEATHTTLHFNIPRQHVDHSPSGWEWGYGGSGPSDYALNILAQFIPPAPDPGHKPAEDAPDGEWHAWADRLAMNVTLWDGSVVHADVWRLHHDFKFQFIARLPREGGTIAGKTIRAWIADELARREDDG